MARTANPESTNKAVLVAALALLFLLTFMPASVLAWLSAPRSLISMVLSPISDPVKRIATWIAPASPKPDDARLAHAEAEREAFRTLYLQAQAKIEQLNSQIQDLQKGAAVSDERFTPVHAAVIGNTSAAAGGAIQVRAGRNKHIEKNTVVTTNGDQLVGRVASVEPFACWVTLLTDKAIGPIDGVILSDDAKVLFNIRNLSPIRGERALQGQVQYKTAAPGQPPLKNEAPVIGAVVRLEDQSWPRTAQRLIVGKITKVNELPGGRTIVTVKPQVELERVGDVILFTNPQPEAGGAGGANR